MVGHDAHDELQFRSELEMLIFVAWCEGRMLALELLSSYPFTFGSAVLRNRGFVFDRVVWPYLASLVFSTEYERQREAAESSRGFPGKAAEEEEEEGCFDAWEVLGLKKGATMDEAKRSYRKLALKLHPDKNPGDQHGAEVKMSQLNAAYEQVVASFEVEQPNQPEEDDDVPSSRARRHRDDDAENANANTNKDAARAAAAERQAERRAYAETMAKARGSTTTATSTKNSKKKQKKKQKKKNPPEPTAPLASSSSEQQQPVDEGNMMDRCTSPLCVALAADARSIFLGELMRLLYTSGTASVLARSLDKAGNTALHFAVYHDRRFAIDVLIQFAGEHWHELVLSRNAAGELPAGLARPDAACKSRVDELTKAANERKLKLQPSFDWPRLVRLSLMYLGAMLPLRATLLKIFVGGFVASALALATATLTVVLLGGTKRADPIAPILYFSVVSAAALTPSVVVAKTGFFPGWVLSLPWIYYWLRFILRGRRGPFDFGDENWETSHYYARRGEKSLAYNVHTVINTAANSTSAPAKAILRACSRLLGPSTTLKRYAPELATFLTGVALTGILHLLDRSRDPGSTPLFTRGIPRQ